MIRRRGENIITLPDLQENRSVFRDRKHAGEVLADMLPELIDTSSIILGIPAGGVPVGAEVARRLDLAFDLAVVSKITLPWNSEAGYGAVAFDQTVLLNESLLSRLNLTSEQIEQGIARTTRKVLRRIEKIRGKRPFPDLSGRTAVLIDDGLASGFTMLAAINALKKKGADVIYAAVPTAHRDAVRSVAEHADLVYCANIRSGNGFAVAEAYADWHDVPESEVKKILEEFDYRQSG